MRLQNGDKRELLSYASENDPVFRIILWTKLKKGNSSDVSGAVLPSKPEL